MTKPPVSLQLVTDEKVKALEAEVNGIKDKQDNIYRLQTTIAETLAANAVTQKQIADTLVKMEMAIEEGRDFQIRAEEARKADNDHRSRLDRRMDNIQRDMARSSEEHKAELDKLWDHARRSDRENLEKVHALETKLATGSVHINQNKDLMKDFGVKSWQIIFWVITFLIAFMMGDKFK